MKYLLLICFVRGLFIHYLPLDSDELFREAQEMLIENSCDIKTIDQKLRNSQSPEALALLGEINLLGYFVPANLTAALEYFQLAYNKNSAEAAFYLLVVNIQNYYFDIKHPMLPPFSSELLRSLLKTATKRGSHLARAFSISNYQRCKSLYSPKIFPKDYIKISELCEYSEPRVNEFAAQLAENSMQYIISKGHKFFVPDKFSDEAFLPEDIDRVVSYTEKSIKNTDEKYYWVFGQNYLFGNFNLGIEKNITKAIGYYRNSADEGSRVANEILGVAFIKGIGVEQNYTRAFEHLKKAMDLGSYKAIAVIGYLLYNSVDVPLDFYDEYENESTDIVISVLSQVAQIDQSAEALNNLGVIYLSQSEDYYSMASFFISCSCLINYPPAFYNMGILYSNGISVPKSYKLAIKFFWEAIRIGPLSRFARFAYSQSKTADTSGAFWAHSIASFIGFDRSTSSLAYLMINNLIPFRCRVDDLCLAWLYYIMIAQGESEGYLQLAKMALKGQGVAKNVTEAIWLLSQIKDSGEALYMLAAMYENGQGVHKNPAKAKEMYEEIMKRVENEELPAADYYPAFIAWSKIRLYETYNTVYTQFLRLFSQGQALIT